MKRLLIGLMVAAVAALGFGGVGASAAASGQLTAFGTGTVTITEPDSATIVNNAGQFGGVYNKTKTQSGKLLKDAFNLSFNSTGDVAGGAPRFSIPINTDGAGGSVAGYAFLDVLGCNPLATSGTPVTVSISDPNCGVNFQSVEYANWSAFATANPSYRIAQGHFPFIIADEPGSYAVNSINLG